MTTYLNVPFSDKDRVKALGARWVGERRQWCVPKGRDTAPFEQWVIKKAAPVMVSTAQGDVSAMALSEYMTEVSAAMTRAAPAACWVSAELSEFRSKDGYWMLSLVEYDESRREVAKTSAMAFGAVVMQVEDKIRAANVKMEKGIKILVKVRAEMHPRYGFRLMVLDIDPKFTLGDMEIRLAQIRATLQAEGVYDLQRQLASPKDYTSVAVVAPEGAAGLGDFMREAEVLQSWGLTTFETYTCLFQGDRAAKAIAAQLSALREAMGSGDATYDAVVVIRGGGAATDLAWLNDLDLARAIAKLDVPVLTGIGHERDNTSLDEVAHRRFDTPSKVINHIVSTVVNRATEGLENITSVLRDAQRVIVRHETATEGFLNVTRSQSEKIVQKAESDAKALLQSIHQRSHHLLDVSLTTVEAYAREVLGLSPANTLERGYALVRDVNGRVLTTCAQARTQQELRIQMKDGFLSAKPEHTNQAQDMAAEQLTQGETQ